MSWTALGTTLGCHHSAGISRRVLSSAQNCCTVPVAAAKTQVLPATALATAGGFPIQERRKLSGIGHSCLPCRDSSRHAGFVARYHIRQDTPRSSPSTPQTPCAVPPTPADLSWPTARTPP